VRPNTRGGLACGRAAAALSSGAPSPAHLSGIELGAPSGGSVGRFKTNLSGWEVGAEEFLGAVLESVAQPIWVVDPGGLIRFANPAAMKALGYDARELVGRPSHETVHFRRPDGSPFPASECPMLLPRLTGETCRTSSTGSSAVMIPPPPDPAVTITLSSTALPSSSVLVSVGSALPRVHLAGITAHPTGEWVAPSRRRDEESVGCY
jgi:hypothetical protein